LLKIKLWLLNTFEGKVHLCMYVKILLKMLRFTTTRFIQPITTINTTNRLLFNNTRFLATTNNTNIQYSTLPYVKDTVVKFTLVDYAGKSQPCAGREGQTLMEAAKFYGNNTLEDDSNGGGLPVNRIRTDRWVEDQFGEGPVSNIPHVVLTRDVWNKLPPPGEREISVLKTLSDVTPHSRLATEIVLSKVLDGATIHVPDTVPVDDLV
jgi:hypothetical protein